MRNSKRALTIGSEKVEIPGIEVIEGGKAVVRPEVIQAVTQLANLAQLVKIRQSLEREQIKGRLNPRTLDATERRQHLDLLELPPHMPWATAAFVNDGPESVKIALNREDDEYELWKDEDLSADFTKADERIHTIFYHCDPGETASVRALGKY